MPGTGLAQRRPLAVEGVLHELVEENLIGELLPPPRDRLRVACDQFAFPVVPGRAAVDLLQRHEERIVVQPERVVLRERLEAEMFAAEVRERATEEPLLGDHDRVEIDAVLRRGEDNRPSPPASASRHRPGARGRSGAGCPRKRNRIGRGSCHNPSARGGASATTVGPSRPGSRRMRGPPAPGRRSRTGRGATWDGAGFHWLAGAASANSPDSDCLRDRADEAPRSAGTSSWRATVPAFVEPIVAPDRRFRSVRDATTQSRRDSTGQGVWAREYVPPASRLSRPSATSSSQTPGG